MNGYVKNITRTWTHAMKRSVGPGMEIPLMELYKQYGEKHDLKEGTEFVEWLKTVKLRNTHKWKVYYEDEASAKEVQEEVVKSKAVDDHVTPMVPSKMEIKDVVLMSVREARDTVPKINNLKLLKQSFQEANQLAGKDTMCLILRKRIKELQAGR